MTGFWSSSSGLVGRFEAALFHEMQDSTSCGIVARIRHESMEPSLWSKVAPRDQLGGVAQVVLPTARESDENKLLLE